MNNIIKALGWAALILAVSLAGNAGLLSGDMTRTLIIVLPVMAILTLRGRGGCLPCPLVRSGEQQ